MLINSFVKSHGLGNDYIVLDSDNLSFELSTKAIIRICDVHFGIGSDGILLKVPSEKADFGLRIFNPDGSEAENCGNGLRIFTKFLFDHKYTEKLSFSVDIMGRHIWCEILEQSEGKVSKVRVEMGKANFDAQEIPIVFSKPECLRVDITIEKKKFDITCVSMGNPHCVVLREELDVDELVTYGPKIQSLSMFPNGTNVQFAKINTPNEVEIRIFERGAGYTLASGSSSCGVAAALYKNGLVSNNVTIKMPGGCLAIEISEEWDIRMTGEVREIVCGTLSEELINDLLR